MKLNALFLNCTLKQKPKTSNTEAFIRQAQKFFDKLGVTSKKIRIADYNIAYGITSDEGDDDEWPKILQLIKKTDILIIATPIWRGDRSSIAKKIAERLEGIMTENQKDNSQYPTYNKVAGVMVDGNEDGAKKAISNILFDLNEHGFTLPVNAFSYYVGKAGPGPSYIEAEGDKHEFTNNMLLIMLQNLVHLAITLKEAPYSIDLQEVEEKAKQMSS
ncbi:flavodoxin family protein [Mesonia aquimarina]|uniref:flavodoxin family protein n=1 Tax=Mesonia aquimarina TaxID=1504967 RepID=UPI000EF5E92A|nr:NAD(P)H-dependent oxidoreductase [Mesonia aquimarina]